MKSARRACALVALLCCAAGCGATPAAEEVSVERFPIVYGEPSGAGGSEDGVLLLRTTVDGEELLCTASLVAKNLVLTARHCVSNLIQGPFNCTVQGELVDNPGGAGRLGAHLPADSLELYGGATPRSTPLAHGAQVISTLSQTICLNDIAFVVLDREIDLPVLPLRLGGRARLSELGTLVGYGLDERMGQFIDFRTQVRKRKPHLAIAGVGPDSIDDGVTTVPPRTLLLEGPSGCVGDSGGPLLAEKTQAILGVYSLLDGEDCVDPSVRHELAHVPAFQVLIDEAFAAAGATPTREFGPVPEPCEDAGTPAEDAGACGTRAPDSGSDTGGAAIERADSAAGAGCALRNRGRQEKASSVLGLVLLALGLGAVRKEKLREARGVRHESQRRPSSGSSPGAA